MKTMKNYRRSALLILLLVAVVYVGCEDSEVTAPSDAQVFVHADPTAIVIDEGAGETQSSATIRAQLFGTNGFPLSGISVAFSTTGGTLASGAIPGQPAQLVETDSNGRASDVLTLAVDDEVGDGDQVEVTIFSGALSGSVFVTRTLRGANQPPEALADISPNGGQRFGQNVTFDSSRSSDPDNDPLTCFKWTVLSDNPAVPDVVRQQSSSAPYLRSFGEAATLTVILQVSDEVDGTFCNSCDGDSASCGADDSLFGAVADVQTYEISCDPSPPTVTIATGNTIAEVGEDVVLSATASDPQSGISRHTWSCGNNTGSGTVLGNVLPFTCVYTEPTVVGFPNTATLSVENTCGQIGQDTVSITVNPATP